MNTERLAALRWLAIILLLGWLVYLLGPILTPFVAAIIIAYICNPMVNWLCEKKMSRTSAVLLVMMMLMCLTALLVLIMLPMLIQEGSRFVTRLPDLLETVRVKLLPHIREYLDIDLEWDQAMLKNFLSEHLPGAGAVAAKALPWLGGSAMALVTISVNLVLTPLALFYFLRDWPLILSQIDTLIPRRWHDQAQNLAAEADEVLSQFLRGQVSVMVLMSAFYTVGLYLCGLDFALPIGVAAGMLVFVPYLGMIIGLALATLAAFSQFDQFTDVLLVWAVFASGQLLEGMAVTPRLVGDRIGLHPLAVIFALMAFGQLFGFFGILLALPASAVLLVGLRHIRAWYLSAPIYQEKS